MVFKNNTDEHRSVQIGQRTVKIIPIWIFEFFQFLDLYYFGMKTSNYFSVIFFKGSEKGDRRIVY